MTARCDLLLIATSATLRIEAIVESASVLKYRQMPEGARLRWWIVLGMAVISPAQTLTTLVTFNGTNGNGPSGPLVQGTDGNFYGTTYAGGSNNLGTVFEISPAGTLTTLYSFGSQAPRSKPDADGADPQGGVIQGTDGNFYGVTYKGGAYGNGTVYRITSGGMLTTLYSFGSQAGDGAEPIVPLIQATDGNFYGTTQEGGTNNLGTIFKITPGGTLTTLYSFPGYIDGSSPLAPLIQATDGNLYGTAVAGGASYFGTVFRFTPSGALTTLYSFTNGANGGSPEAGLIQATDGNLYGTAVQGGAQDYGTIFKITPSGTLTTLHSFTDADGSSPTGALIQATDGNFYGSTNLGGAQNYGTIFKITSSGTLTTLHTFTGLDGSKPYQKLTQGSDGNLYGTTGYGGANNLGTVFELQLGLPPAITAVENAEGGASAIAPNTWVTLKGSNLAPPGDSRTWQSSDFVDNQMPTELDGVSVTLNGENAYVYYISPSQINILTPPDLAAGPVQVEAETYGGTSATFADQVEAESPSFFIFGGGPYVAATHADGSLVGSESLYPGQSTPAQPGETVVLYANGFGPTSTPVASGSETQSGSLNPLPAVSIGGIPASVQFAGLISPGLFQFNVVVPASAPAGDNALVATYSGLSTQSGVLITVGP